MQSDEKRFLSCIPAAAKITWVFILVNLSFGIWQITKSKIARQVYFDNLTYINLKKPSILTTLYYSYPTLVFLLLSFMFLSLNFKLCCFTLFFIRAILFSFCTKFRSILYMYIYIWCNKEIIVVMNLVYHQYQLLLYCFYTTINE